MSDHDPNDVSPAREFGGVEAGSGRSVGAASGAAPTVPANVCNPLSKPYRTGSYLIFDMPTCEASGDRCSGGGPDHFRTAMELEPNPYPASGSHQLNADQLTQILSTKVVSRYEPRDLFLVDLREESHGFINRRAASWYADNDFGNVGVAKSQIERDERARLEVLEGETTQVFKIDDDSSDNRGQERMMPVSYQTVTAETAATERTLVDEVVIGNCTVHYLRIPVTDHCAPSDVALAEFGKLATSSEPKSSWLHFHCHGGDGRTTTFLALYDMVCWKRRSRDPLPDLEVFARRQYGLPPNYCLNPDGCDWTKPSSPPTNPPSPPTAGWKRPLALKRWQVLKDFHEKLSAGL